MLVLRKNVALHDVPFVIYQDRLCMFTELNTYMAPFCSRNIMVSAFNKARLIYSLHYPTFAKA